MEQRDIVERLRSRARTWNDASPGAAIENTLDWQAATEIERLREELLAAESFALHLQEQINDRDARAMG